MNTDTNTLTRRGFSLGKIATEAEKTPTASTDLTTASARWQQGKSVYLPSAVTSLLSAQEASIAQAAELYQALLNEQPCDEFLDQEPYASRWQAQFESLGSSVNEGDDQEIETVLFDVLENGDIIAEDLWAKVSWLSFYEQDASLRFRFSFGMDHVEDVAADKQRQHYAALLCDAVFPEACVITDNQNLHQSLNDIIGSQEFNFVERIVYFNAPQGGAYLHHDLERGHAGVVYAQLSGSTYWLALPKYQLVDELIYFIEQCAQSEWPVSLTKEMRSELVELAESKPTLDKELETFANSALIHCMNETQEFVQQLISNGYSQRLNAGDVILLPQADLDHCCWHSVFCLSEQAGQALSFAIRT